MVIVERLAAPVGLEQGATQRLNERVRANIGIREVDEHAGLDIACRVDMKIIAPACDAAADILGIILKIEDEHGFAGFAVAHFAQPVVHVFALLGRGDQFRVGVVPDRHIVEISAEFNALFDHQVDEFFACDRVDILARIADGDAKEELILL